MGVAVRQAESLSLRSSLFYDLATVQADAANAGAHGVEIDQLGVSWEINGGPGAIRTRGLPLRRRLLYPAELRVRGSF